MFSDCEDTVCLIASLTYHFIVFILVLFSKEYKVEQNGNHSKPEEKVGSLARHFFVSVQYSCMHNFWQIELLQKSEMAEPFAHYDDGLYSEI